MPITAGATRIAHEYLKWDGMAPCISIQKNG